jgi:hypothetical protein
VRKRLAGFLRVAAYLIDGQDFVNARWHKASVEGMNRYIGRTERYILALEAALGKPRVCEIRSKHPGRFDTRNLHDAGAWN